MKKECKTLKSIGITAFFEKQKNFLKKFKNPVDIQDYLYIKLKSQEEITF